MYDRDRDTFFFAAPRRRRSVMGRIAAAWAAVLGSLALVLRALRHGHADISDVARRSSTDVRRGPRAIATAIAAMATERIHDMRDRNRRLTAGRRMRRAVFVFIAAAAAGLVMLPAFAVQTTSTQAGFEGDDGNLAINYTRTITSISVANPTVITTSIAHDLTDGDTVDISGSNSTPSIDGTWLVDVLTATTFTIPVNVTVAGTAGTVSRMDWNGFAPVTWSGTAVPHTATKNTKGWQFTGIDDLQATTSDSGFAGGTKQDDDCPSVITAKAPNKDDLKRIYITHRTGPDGHVYLALAWARIPQNTTSSSAHVAFEFNQNDPATDACGAGSDSLVERSLANNGDMLIVYDFEGGSSPVVLKLLRWKDSGTCEQTGKAAVTGTGCWVATPNFTDWAAKVNDAQVNDAIAPIPENLQTQEFGEAIIDLTDAGVFPAQPTSCVSFGRAFGVSRSSGNSGTAQMKDLVGPADVNISNCATVVVKKVTKDVSGNVITNDATHFTFSTTVQTLPGPISVANFDLTGQPSGTPSDTNTIANAKPNQGLTVTEAAPSSPYSLVNIGCVGGSNVSSSTVTRTATFDLGAGQTVTCTFTNQKQRQESAMNTAPFVYPNDTATVTPSTATGSVEFKLYGPTTGKTAEQNCAANTATGLLYSETVNLPASGTKTASTHNPGTTGTPTSFKIDTAGASTVYWRVTYSGDTNLFGRVSCAENIAVTLTGDTSGGTNVP